MEALAETTFPEFLRNTIGVTELLEGGDVILHRRGADDLRLTVASRAPSIKASLETIGRLITAVLQDGVVRERIGRQAPLPWLSFLPQAARERFYVELFECIEGAGSLGPLAPTAR